MEGNGKKWKEMVRVGAVRVGDGPGGGGPGRQNFKLFFFLSRPFFFSPIYGVFLGIAVVSARSHH